MAHLEIPLTFLTGLNQIVYRLIHLKPNLCAFVIHWKFFFHSITRFTLIHRSSRLATVLMLSRLITLNISVYSLTMACHQVPIYRIFVNDRDAFLVSCLIQDPRYLLLQKDDSPSTSKTFKVRNSNHWTWLWLMAPKGRFSLERPIWRYHIWSRFTNWRSKDGNPRLAIF